MRKDILKTFRANLNHLMETHNCPRASDLAKGMIKAGIIEVNEIDPEATSRSAERSITNHLNELKEKAPSMDWIDRYCKFFNCSADYLFGYIDSPTHAAATVTDLTGLTEAAANRLLSLADLNNVTGYTDVLSTLFESSVSLEIVLKDLLRYFSYSGNTEAVNVQPDKDMEPLYIPLNNISEITLSHDLAILQKEAAESYKKHPDFHSYDYYDETKRSTIEANRKQIRSEYGSSPNEQLLANLEIQYSEEKDPENRMIIAKMMEGIFRKIDLDKSSTT